MMTLDEAIEHLICSIKENKFNCEECKQEHIQLLNWLKELKEYNERENKEREALLEKLEEQLSDLRFIINYERRHGSIIDVEKNKAKLEKVKEVISLVKSQFY